MQQATQLPTRPKPIAPASSVTSLLSSSVPRGGRSSPPATLDAVSPVGGRPLAPHRLDFSSEAAGGATTSSESGQPLCDDRLAKADEDEGEEEEEADEECTADVPALRAAFSNLLSLHLPFSSLSRPVSPIFSQSFQQQQQQQQQQQLLQHQLPDSPMDAGNMGSFGHRNLSSPVHFAPHKKSFSDSNVSLSPYLNQCAIKQAEILAILSLPSPNEKATLLFDDFALLAQLLTMDESIKDGHMNGKIGAQYAALVFEKALTGPGPLSSSSPGTLQVDLGPHIAEALHKVVSKRSLSRTLEDALAQRLSTSTFKSVKHKAAAGYQLAFIDATGTRAFFC